MAVAPVPSHTVSQIGSDKDWEPVHPSTDMVLGQRYRLTMRIRAPYTPTNIQRLEDSLRLGVAVKNIAEYVQMKQTIKIEGFQAHYPNEQVGGTPTWAFTMIFVKVGGGTPLAVIIGAVALVVTLSILCAVVSSTIEKEGAKIKDIGVSTVFNPFFLVAAVIVVLAWKGRSLKSIGG